MALYAIDRGAVTLASGADVWAMISASSRKLRLIEASFIGQGATSAAAAYAEVQLGACTAPTGGSPTSLTANKLDQDSVAAGSTYAFGHTTPSASFLAKLRLGWNAYGGGYRWTARRDAEITHRNGGSISAQQTAGTSVCSTHAIVDEV